MTRIQKERFGSAQEYEAVSVGAAAAGPPDEPPGRPGPGGWGLAATPARRG